MVVGDLLLPTFCVCVCLCAYLFLLPLTFCQCVCVCVFALVDWRGDACILDYGLPVVNSSLSLRYSRSSTQLSCIVEAEGSDAIIGRSGARALNAKQWYEIICHSSSSC